MGRQLIRMLWPPALCQVAWCGAQQKIRTRQLARNKISLQRRLRHRDDRDVVVLVCHVDRSACHQFHRHTWEQDPEAGQKRRQLVHRKCRRAQDAQGSAGLGSRGTCLHVSVFQVGQYTQRLLQVRCANVGQGQAAGRAMQQPRAEICLQFCDRPCHDRRGHVQRPRRASEAALAGDSGKHAQRANLIHGRMIAVPAMACCPSPAWYGATARLQSLNRRNIALGIQAAVGRRSPSTPSCVTTPCPPTPASLSFPSATP